MNQITITVASNDDAKTISNILINKQLDYRKIDNTFIVKFLHISHAEDAKERIRKEANIVAEYIVE